jgi:hypothetical protein
LAVEKFSDLPRFGEVFFASRDDMRQPAPGLRLITENFTRGGFGNKKGVLATLATYPTHIRDHEKEEDFKKGILVMLPKPTKPLNPLKLLNN